MLEEVFTLEEASQRWGVKYVTLKQRFYRGVDETLIINVDYKRSGKIYLVTRAGMTKLYGLPKNEKREVIVSDLMELGNIAEKLNIKISGVEALELIGNKCIKASNSKLKRAKFSIKTDTGEVVHLEAKVIGEGFLIRVIEE